MHTIIDAPERPRAKDPRQPTARLRCTATVCTVAATVTVPPARPSWPGLTWYVAILRDAGGGGPFACGYLQRGDRIRRA
jgi:hypothetical protein